MRIAFVTVLFLLALLVGGIGLQIWLSRRESRWPGLLLPILCGLYSLLMVCSVAVLPDMSTADVVGAVLSVLLLGNVPTAVLLVIYAACREKRRKAAQLARMRALDLE